MLLIALLACADPPVDSAPPEPVIELGTGEIEWEALLEGQAMPVIQGPQGGFHVLVSVRVGGVHPGDAEDLGDPTNPTLTFTALHAGEDITLTGEYTQGLDPILGDAAPYTHELIGRFLILDIEGDEVLDGETLALTVAFEGVDGLRIEDACTVNTYPDPRNH